MSELGNRSIEIGFANGTPWAHNVRPDIDSQGFRCCAHDLSIDVTR
jgi:hypothetical protein